MRRLGIAFAFLLLASTARAQCDSSLPAMPPPETRLGLEIPVKNQCTWDEPLIFDLKRIAQFACFPGIACSVALGTETTGVLPLTQGGTGTILAGVTMGDLIVGGSIADSLDHQPIGADNCPLVADSGQAHGMRWCGDVGPLVVSGGITGSTASPGFQHKRVASCTPGDANLGTTCGTAITWDNAFVDDSYSLSCSMTTPTNVPMIVNIDAKNASSIEVVHENHTAATATGQIECIGVHD